MTPPTSQPDGSAPLNPGARARTINNLKFLGLAMHNYATINGGRLPAAAIRDGGKPLLSWRVAILPYLEANALYERFHLHEAWDSPHNEALLKEMPRVYQAVAHQGSAPYATHYQGIVGPGSLFDGEEGTRIADVTYEASPTLMVVEAADPVPWTKPEDLPYDEARPLPELGGHSPDGVYVSLADGSVRFLGKKVAPGTLRALIRRSHSQVVSPEEIGPWQDEWSG